MASILAMICLSMIVFPPDRHLNSPRLEPLLRGLMEVRMCNVALRPEQNRQHQVRPEALRFGPI